MQRLLLICLFYNQNKTHSNNVWFKKKCVFRKCFWSFRKSAVFSSFNWQSNNNELTSRMELCLLRIMWRSRRRRKMPPTLQRRSQTSRCTQVARARWRSVMCTFSLARRLSIWSANVSCWCWKCCRRCDSECQSCSSISSICVGASRANRRSRAKCSRPVCTRSIAVDRTLSRCSAIDTAGRSIATCLATHCSSVRLMLQCRSPVSSGYRRSATARWPNWRSNTPSCMHLNQHHCRYRHLHHHHHHHLHHHEQLYLLDNHLRPLPHRPLLQPRKSQPPRFLRSLGKSICWLFEKYFLGGSRWFAWSEIKARIAETTYSWHCQWWWWWWWCFKR